MIRPCRDDDWSALASIITEVLAAGETYAVPVLDDAEARDFWLGQPGAVAVAELDGVVVGTAKMGPNRPAQGSHIGTASFMVSGAARGAGVGRALGEHVVAGTGSRASRASSSTRSSPPTPRRSRCGAASASR